MEMKSVVLALVVFPAIFKISHGLACYDCLYFKTGNHESGDPTCQWGINQTGRIPFECDARLESMSSPGLYNASRNSPTEPVRLGCMKLASFGQVNSAAVKIMLRACAYSRRIGEGCQEQTLGKWRKDAKERGDPWSVFIADYGKAHELHEDSKLKACFCTQTLCNNGDESSSSGVTPGVVQDSLWISAVEAILAFKYFFFVFQLLCHE